MPLAALRSIKGTDFIPDSPSHPSPLQGSWRPLLAHVFQGRRFSVFLYASFLIPYFWLTLPRLHLPGPPLDETVTVMPLFGENGTFSLKVRETALPLNLVAYHGAMESYIVLPFIRFFQSTTEALRLCSVLCGALTLVAVYAACRAFFQDVRIAWGAAFFLSTFSPYVTGTRLGIYHGAIPLLFQTAVLVCLMRFIETGRNRHVYIASVLQGGAVSCRSWFLFSMISLWGPSLVLFWKRFGAAFSPRSWTAARKMAFCLCFFIAGAFPLSFYIVLKTEHFETAVADRFPVTRMGYDNLKYAENLGGRLREFLRLWSHDDFLVEGFPLAPQPAYKRVFWGAALASVCLWLALSIAFKIGPFSPRQKALFLVYPLLLLLFSPFTLSGVRPNHLFPMIPPLAVAIVLALVVAVDSLSPRLGTRGGTMIVVLALTALKLGDFPSLQSRLKTMKDVSPYYTDAVYPLSDWLLANPLPGPLVVSFRISQPLMYLMSSRIEFERFERSDPKEKRAGAPAYLIAYSEKGGFRIYPEDFHTGLPEFAAVAEKVREFRGLNGEPMIDVYRVRTGVPGLMGFAERHPGFVSSDDFVYAYNLKRVL